MRKAILVLECLLFLLVSYLLLASGGTLLDALVNGATTSASDMVSSVLVFAVTPVCLLVSLLFAITRQKKSDKALYWPFVCVVLALLLMLHSWGMHAFMAASVSASLGSIAFAAIGLWKARRQF